MTLGRMRIHRFALLALASLPLALLACSDDDDDSTSSPTTKDGGNDATVDAKNDSSVVVDSGTDARDANTADAVAVVDGR